MRVRHHLIFGVITARVKLWLWNRKLSRQYQAIMQHKNPVSVLEGSND